MKLAAYYVLAGALLAGCAGAKSVPAAAPQSNTAQSTLTFSVPETVTTSSGTRTPQFVSSSTASIVVKFIGDDPNNPPSSTGVNPPATATTAATVNVVATGNASPAPGQCIVSGTVLNCSIQVSLPVGKLDVYILCYPSPSGAGTVLSSSVTTVQINSDGSVVQPGTANAATLNSPTANVNASGASVTLASTLALTPNSGSLPNPSITPNGFGQAQPAPVSLSSPQVPTYKAADGSTVAAGQTITPVTITDTDTSGSTCLIYVKSGATSATPCPLTQSGSSVTLSNTSDAYVVAYANKFIPAAGITLNARFSTSTSLLSTTQQLTVTPTAVAGGAALGTASSGAILYDSTSSAVYTGLQSSTTPLTATAYSSSTGYGTPAKVAITSVNGSASTTTLTGSSGVTGIALGPDSNIWMAENNGSSTTQYVAVYLVNASGLIPGTSTSVASGTGKFIEYTLTGGTASATVTGIATFNSYVYVTDTKNDLWRINPAKGTFISNAALASGPSWNSNMVTFGSNIYVADTANKKLVSLAADTSTTPAGNLVSVTSSTSTFANATPSALGTDGATYIFVQNGTAVAQYNGSFSQTLSSAAFGSASGGFGLGADGYFWTQSASGAGYMAAINISTAGSTVPVSTCNAGTFVQGANGVILGPDNTVLTAPAGSTTTAAFCGVIY
jgi:hypothetical protein